MRIADAVSPTSDAISPAFAMAAKKNIEPEVLLDAIKGVLHHSTNVKKRNFLETLEIHFGLKNFDPARDKRIAGSTELPHAPRKKFAALCSAMRST